MVVGKRKLTARNLTARLLVLGDKHVGKSASIVRFTTGRYIHDYCKSTDDWLYRHSLGVEARQSAATMVELLEQKDLRFNNTHNIFISSSLAPSQQCELTISGGLRVSTPLASRVAPDQQIDNEQHEKQQLLNKLHWANAYIVIYAINDISTFNKAIKYLNLIANNINSPLDNFTKKESISEGGSPSDTNSHNQSKSRTSTLARAPRNILSAGSQSSNSFKQINQIGNNISSSSNRQKGGNGLNLTRRPILLLGNKRDLESSVRQVQQNDARLLAMRHQAMFAETSVANCGKSIDRIIHKLLELVEPASLREGVLGKQESNENRIIRWTPIIELSISKPSTHSTGPVWDSLVKSKAVGQVATISSAEQDVRLIRPLKMASVVNALTSSASAAKRKPDSSGCPPVDGSGLAVQGRSLADASHQNRSRYEGLKSSFKKASMAIVSSKALARGHKTPSHSKQAISDESKRSSIDEDASATDNQADVLQRFRKPLFRYRDRRKTVAFDQIGFESKLLEVTDPFKLSSVTDLELDGQHDLSALAVETKMTDRRNGTPSWNYGLNRYGRSSSSPSTTDTDYTGLAMARNESASVSSSNYSSGASVNTSRPPPRDGSRSTLSRASTSGGSYEESGDEPLSRSSTKTNCNQLVQQTTSYVKGAKNQPGIAKSVKSTLTNFTRSSNVPAPAARRLLCNTLLKCKNLSTKAITQTEPVLAEVARAENVRVIPVVGFCK